VPAAILIDFEYRLHTPRHARKVSAQSLEVVGSVLLETLPRSSSGSCAMREV